jgi:hypothetical protein
MGKYLFPGDLIVYLNGMMLDLGDMSAPWRNHHEASVMSDALIEL